MGEEAMNFMHGREHLQAGDSVIVDCDTQCNVCVMTDTEFANYRSGRNFRHLGGRYERFPIRITVPTSGYWNTTLDLGGASANIRYSITYTKQT